MDDALRTVADFERRCRQLMSRAKFEFLFGDIGDPYWSTHTSNRAAFERVKLCPRVLTGVAGPEPDEDGNPVGLVYVAAVRRDGRIKAARHEFGNRAKDEICSAAIGAALALVEELLTDRVPCGATS